MNEITIAGVGPILAPLTLPLPDSGAQTGGLILAGPSESGKSTVAAALVYLLTGTRPDGSPVDPGVLSADAGIVRVVADGAAYELRISRTGRKVWRRGEATVSAVADRAQLLGLLGAAPLAALVRGIVCPAELLRQAEVSQGRPLRETLMSALPERSLPDAVAALLGGPLLPTDAADTKRAVAATTAATAARDRAQGALDGARGAHERHEAQGAPVAPDAAATTAAEATVAAGEAWASWRRAGGASERRAAQQAALDDWERRAALVPAAVAFDGAPPPKVPSVRAEEQAVANAKAALDALPVGQAAALGLHEKRLSAATRWATLPTASCDLCGQIVPPARISQVASAAKVQIEAERKTAQDLAAAARRAADTRLAEAEAALTRAQATADRMQRELDGYREAADARRRRVDAINALGPKPVVDPEPPGAPPMPATSEPTAEAVADARALLARAARADTEARAYAARAATLAEEVDLASRALAAREAELVRARAVDAAHKSAPGRLLQQQMADWERVGVGLRRAGVELRLRGAGEVDGLDLLIDGRPWHYASTGRRVLASSLLAAALRALAARRYPDRGGVGGFADLPIIIDDAQAWSGSGYPSRGPIVWLLTEPSDRTGPTAIEARWGRL